MAAWVKSSTAGAQQVRRHKPVMDEVEQGDSGRLSSILQQDVCLLQTAEAMQNRVKKKRYLLTSVLNEYNK